MFQKTNIHTNGNLEILKFKPTFRGGFTDNPAQLTVASPGIAESIPTE